MFSLVPYLVGLVWKLSISACGRPVISANTLGSFWRALWMLSSARCLSSCSKMDPTMYFMIAHMWFYTTFKSLTKYILCPWYMKVEILKSICMSTVSIFARYLMTTVAFYHNVLLPLIGVETKCILMTSWRARDHGSCCLHWSTTIADEILTGLVLSFVLFSDLYLTPKMSASTMTHFSLYKHTKNKGVVLFSLFDAERTFRIF